MDNCKPTIVTTGEHPAGSRATAERPRVLYVDDSDFVRDSICSILAANGWNCESAAGGATALPWLTTDQWLFDILITDHQMPGMTGLEFVRAVRATTAFMGKIVVHSTMLNSSERTAYVRLGVNAIVPKNGNPESLLKTIQELQQQTFETEINPHEMQRLQHAMVWQ